MWLVATVLDATLLGRGFSAGQDVYFRCASGGIYHVHTGIGFAARVLSADVARQSLRAERDAQGRPISVDATLAARLEKLWTAYTDIVGV